MSEDKVKDAFHSFFDQGYELYNCEYAKEARKSIFHFIRQDNNGIQKLTNYGSKVISFPRPSQQAINDLNDNNPCDSLDIDLSLIHI